MKDYIRKNIKDSWEKPNMFFPFRSLSNSIVLISKFLFITLIYRVMAEEKFILETEIIQHMDFWIFPSQHCIMQVIGNKQTITGTQIRIVPNISVTEISKLNLIQFFLKIKEMKAGKLWPRNKTHGSHSEVLGSAWLVILRKSAMSMRSTGTLNPGLW